jgi:hypothetical protein
MTNIHETAYPILPAEPSAAELKASFTPTTAEMRFVRRQSRQESTPEKRASKTGVTESKSGHFD